MNFRLKRQTRYPWLFLIGSLTGFGLSFIMPTEERLNAILTMLGVCGGMTAFLYSKHSQDVILFRELFREFNTRYDQLNDQLNEIRRRPEGVPLKDADVGILYDYFNLCAEEQMYERAGCIDADVWVAWENGMRFFAQDAEIVTLWEKEMEQGSYYGFKIPYSNAPINPTDNGGDAIAA